METMSTITKKMTVWGCKGGTLHLTSGVALLKFGRGYECPECGAEVVDYSATPLGREWLSLVRPDTYSSPPPRVRIVKNSV